MRHLVAFENTSGIYASKTRFTVQSEEIGSISFNSAVPRHYLPDAAVVCPKALMMFFKLENPTRRFSPADDRRDRVRQARGKTGRYDGPRHAPLQGVYAMSTLLTTPGVAYQTTIFFS